MTVWTDERVETLKKLWADGFSAREIVAKMKCGFTRSAVLGKVHRLDLNGRAVSNSGGRPAGAKVERKSGVNRRRIKELRRIQESLRAGSSASEVDPLQFKDPLNGIGIPFVERGNFQCSWIIDDVTKNVCGHPVGHSVFSWCPFHLLVGTVNPMRLDRNRSRSTASDTLMAAKKKPLSARKLALLRAAKTGSEAKYGMGGLEKTHKKPAPVTLPRLKFLEKREGEA